MQALDFSKPLKSSNTNEKLRIDFRQKISFVNKDEFMQPKIEEAKNFIINMK
jgi:histidine ammonia-lyase